MIVNNGMLTELIDDVTTKKCTKCGEVKERGEFYSRRNSDKVINQCKECCKQYAKDNRKSKAKLKSEETVDVYIENKQCTKCGEIKHRSEFVAERRLKSGLNSSCRECQKARRQFRKERNNKSENKSRNTDTKKCPDCGQIKTRDKFGRDSGLPDGFDAYCKECLKQKRADNKERLRERNKQTIEINGYPETKKCSQCHEIKPSIEFSKSADAKDGLYSRCKDCDRKYVDKEKLKKYRQRPERIIADRLKRHRRREQVRKTDDGSINHESMAQLLIDQQHLCYHCGRNLMELESKDRHWDHIIALSKGGPHIISNIAWACGKCNNSKHTKDVDEWRESRR